MATHLTLRVAVIWTFVRLVHSGFAVNGDLANWHTGKADDVPAVGGAMDLAVGAKTICVYVEHVTKKVSPNCKELSYPITGEQC